MIFQNLNSKANSIESLTWQTIATSSQKELLLKEVWGLLEQLRSHKRVKDVLPQKGPIFCLGSRENGDFEVCLTALFDNVFEYLLLVDGKFVIETKTQSICFGIVGESKERNHCPSKEAILKIVEGAKLNPIVLANFLNKLDV